MPMRSAFTILTAAVLVALLVAVQRDTFVRRWMLPAATAEVKLRQVLPEVRIEHATFAQAVAELSRLAGVPIDVDPDLLKHLSPDDPLLDLHLREVSLAAALDELLGLAVTEPIDFGEEAGRRVWPRGERVVLRLGPPATDVPTVRVYDVSDLLPPPVPPLPPNSRLSARASACYAIVDLVTAIVPELPSVPQLSPRRMAAKGPAPVGLVGGRLVVAAPAEEQPKVADLVRRLRAAGGLLEGPGE
jgi:hypothetical protein